jgi:DNA repair photolyase
MEPVVKEVYCKSALSKSGLFPKGYALNPYRGCIHGCVYCYSPSVLHELRPWGNFVDVRINMPFILQRELQHRYGSTKKLPLSNIDNEQDRFMIGIGTVTDPYQPIEHHYELTRKCLQQILKFDLPIVIQTKSALVIRDIELIRKFSDKEVGITITMIDDHVLSKFEPRAASFKARVEALERLAENNIDTWVFLGPILPYFTDKDDDLDKLISAVSDARVTTVIIDKLRLKPGVFARIKSILTMYYPEYLQRYDTLFSSGAYRNYYTAVLRKITALCRKYGLKYEVCF